MEKLYTFEISNYTSNVELYKYDSIHADNACYMSITEENALDLIEQMLDVIEDE